MTGFKRGYITAIICLFTYFTSSAQVKIKDTLLLNGLSTDNWLTLSKYYVYFKDQSQQLNAKQIKDSLAAGRFINNKGAKVFNTGYAHHYNCWLAIAIKNDTAFNFPVLWNFYNNDIEFVLYDITNDARAILLDSSSSHIIVSKRSYPVRSVSFKINLPAYTYKILLVKAYTLNGDSIYFPTDITTPEDYLLYEKDALFLLGQFIGYFLFAFFLNLALGIALKNRLHLWLAAYILSLILFNLNDFMLDAAYFSGSFYAYYERLPKIIFPLLAIYFGMQVFQLFINQRKKFPLFFKVFTVFKSILLIVVVCLFTGSFIAASNNILLSLLRMSGVFFYSFGFLLIFINSIAGIIKKNYEAVIYFACSAFLFFGLIEFFVNEWFFTDFFVFKPSDVIAGFCIELFLLTIVFVVAQKKEKDKSIKIMRESAALQKDVSLKILTAQEIERKRIAEDLHDELGSNLAVLKINLQTNNINKYLPEKDYTQINRLIENACNAVRRIAHNLMPPEFNETQLHDLLSGHIASLNKDRDRFQFIVSGEKNDFTKQEELFIYRIILEITNNIIKHSAFTEASIQLIYCQEYLEIMAEDNGIGFLNIKKEGIGLNSIKSRVAYLYGDINIDTGEYGTTILIKIPYNQKDNG